jgi:hypothetical protein
MREPRLRADVGSPGARLLAAVLLGLVGLIQITELAAVAMARQAQIDADRAVARIARMER